MNSRKIQYVSYITMSLLSCNLAAQQCNEQIDLTTPDNRFYIETNGTVMDNRTGLRWQRCPLGYTFSDNETPDFPVDDQCLASTTIQFSWQEALEAVVNLNQGGGYAGITTWRLPTRKELISIVEFKCRYPSINVTAFPDTASAVFYSSTPFFTASGGGVSRIRYINFSNGNAFYGSETASAYVRLVN